MFLLELIFCKHQSKHHPKKHTWKAHVCTHKNQWRPAFHTQGHSKGRANRAFNESKYVPIPCHYCCSKEKLQACSCDKKRSLKRKGKEVPGCSAVLLWPFCQFPILLLQFSSHRRWNFQYLNIQVN